MKKKILKRKKVYVWTWICDFGKGPQLCLFAEATKENLVNNGKPSPEAIPVRVQMGFL
jgi:hypothetical protein